MSKVIKPLKEDSSNSKVNGITAIHRNFLFISRWGESLDIAYATLMEGNSGASQTTLAEHNTAANPVEWARRPW